MRTFIAYITQRCNLRCSFCLEDRTGGYVEPSTAQVAETLKEAWDAGATRVTFMGGETLLRPDVPAILAEARRIGFADITVATSGVALGRSGYLRTLVEHGLDAIELSIHGHTETLANGIAGTRFAFARQAAALGEIAAVGQIKLFVNTVVCPENSAHLVDVAAYVAATCPQAQPELKFKFVELQGRALERARVDGTFLRYAEVDAVALGETLAARGIAFLFYNFPLCRLGRFAPMSIEHTTLATDGRYTDPDAKLEGYVDSGYQLAGRVWPAPCTNCSVRAVCGGIDESYRRRAGDSDLSPREDDPVALLATSLARAGLDPAGASTRLDALATLPRPRSLRNAGSPNCVRFVHPAELEPLELELREKSPDAPAYASSERFALSYRSWTDGDAGHSPLVQRLLAAAVAVMHEADAEGLSLDAARRAMASAACAGWCPEVA